MRRSIMFVGLVLGLVALSGCATMKMGEPMSSAPKMISVDELTDAPKLNLDKPVRVSGVVTAVCTGMPYFELGEDATDDDVVLVMFDCGKCKCEIPAAAKGKKAIVEGKLVEADLSVQDQKHIAEQMGASKDAIAKINAPKKALKIAATYAEIQGVTGNCCGSAECKTAGKCVADAKCACPAGCKCGGDPKKCTNPKCKETGKCQMQADAKAGAAGKCCGSDACKKTGKCVEEQKK